MTAPTQRPATEHDITIAMEAIWKWQVDLVDRVQNVGHKDHSDLRVSHHRALVAPICEGSHDDAYNAIIDSIGTVAAIDRSTLTAAISTAPTLTQKMSTAELYSPQFSSDSVMHASMSGIKRSQASDYRYWHLLTLNQFANHKLGHPVLLLEKSPRARKGATENGAGSAKELDDCMRAVFRNLGGIWLRDSKYLLDAPLPRAWWRVRLSVDARRAAKNSGIDVRDVYDTLSGPENRKLWEAIVGQSARLARPNVLVALTKCRIAGRNDLKEQVRRLMRRTAFLDIDQIDPDVLAEIAKP